MHSLLLRMAKIIAKPQEETKTWTWLNDRNLQDTDQQQDHRVDCHM